MILKRLYEKNEKGELVKDDKGRVHFIGIKVVSAKKVHHFSPSLIQRGVTEGWIVMGKGMIVLAGEDGDVSYKIVRGPGHYCCHCQTALPDGQTSQVHVAANHEGEKSPDPSNPAGYRRDNFFACEKED